MASLVCRTPTRGPCKHRLDCRAARSRLDLPLICLDLHWLPARIRWTVFGTLPNRLGIAYKPCWVAGECCSLDAARNVVEGQLGEARASQAPAAFEAEQTSRMRVTQMLDCDDIAAAGNSDTAQLETSDDPSS